MSRFALLTFCLAVSQVLLGCGSGGPPKQPTVQVTGTLLVDDKPFGPAVLNLSPMDPKSKLPNATGTVKTGGAITFSSYFGSVGIVPGTYGVTLGPDPKSTNNKVPGTAEATVEIKAADKTVEIKLKSITANDPNASLTPLLPPTP